MNNSVDVRIKTDEYNFHFRVVALVMQDGKYLIQNIEGSPYFILPGGHVHLGENSVKALEREVEEELSSKVNEAKLFCIQERLYPNKGKIEQWIENYYFVNLESKLPDNDWDTIENDKGENKLLHFKWVSKEELQNIDLKPTKIKDLIINGDIKDFNYLIDES